jgi:hypothetical protein
LSERSCRTCIRAVAVILLLLAAAATPALAQLQTGDIYVTVQDEKGQPLPGATVTVTGIGAPRVETSNAEGQVRFLSLYPGKYHVNGELEGFSTVEYPDITVSIAGKAKVVLTLSSSVKETITVTADAPLLDERKLNRGTVLNTKELTNIPTARDPWSLLQQVPGVQQDRINVGGNESGQQSDFLGNGATGRDNTFAVDGVIVSDMNAVGGSAIYFDFGAYEEVQFTVSSADVTIATSGVTVNSVTKRGTNEVKGNARFLDTSGSLQAAPGIPDGNRIKGVEEYGADIGGPLWKDHLWGWASFGRNDIANIVQGGQVDSTEIKDINAKLNYQLTPQDSGVVHWWTDNKIKNGRDAGPGFAPAATFDQTTPSYISKLENTYLLNQNLYLTGLWSNNSGKFTLSPQGGLSPFIYIDDNGTINGTNLDFKQQAIIQQERLDGNYFFYTGSASNELKFGGSYRHQDNLSSTVWPHGYEVISCVDEGCAGGDPNQAVIEFFRNRLDKMRGQYTSGWLQDTVSWGNLTLNAGARYDNQTMRNLPAFSAGNPDAQGLLPPLNFTGNNSGGFAWNTIVPRIGATYALGADRKTLLRGSFSRYAEQLGEIPLATRVNPIGYSYAYFYFDDTNHNHQLDPGEINSLVPIGTVNIDPNNPGSLATPNVNDPHLKPAMTNELTASIEQGIARDMLVSFTLTYRRISDIPEDRALIVDQNGVTRAATVNDYELSPSTPYVQGLLPNGQMSAPVPVYDLKPGLTYTGGSYYTNGDRTQRYIGGTLSFTKRLANQWEANAHFTLDDWTWHIGPQFTFYHDPTNLVSDDLGFALRDGDYYEQSTGSGNKGDVIIGSRWSYDANVMYQVAPARPWAFDLAASIDGRQGYPTPPYVNVVGDLGTRHVLIATSTTEFRNPAVMLLNGRLSKDFNFHDFGLTLGLDGFNLLNLNPVLQRQRNGAADNAEMIEEELSPRVFRIGATLHFR